MNQNQVNEILEVRGHIKHIEKCDINMAHAPEPMSVILLGSGIIALILFKGLRSKLS